MKIILGIKNFGKVKSAEISIGGFSVFVGNNNSGKTYIMQLIYGICNNLTRYFSDADLCSRYLQPMDQQAESGRVRIDAGNIELAEAFINAVLEKYKEEIVSDTFYKEIEIGSIYVRLLIEEEERFEWLVCHKGAGNELFDELQFRSADFFKPVIETIMKEEVLKDHNGCILSKFHNLNGIENQEDLSVHLQYKQISSKLVASLVNRMAYDYKEPLFLPPSRTGLFMLYKDFFASKADEAVEMFGAGAFRKDYKKSNNLGITKPVYRFLRFLQTFRPHGESDQNSGLIHFLEEHLIDGKIVIDQADQPVYQAEGTQQALPLYLSSSMVNELAPILYVLQSDYKYLIWDEIETSLHPQKQMELACLLSRMSNAGFSMIVSTHSDTIAAKINNLCLLSFSRLLRGKRAEILKKTGLEEADLFKERIHVYQFENDDSGHSSVRELEYDEVTGYQFSLFNDSVEQLLEETRLILE